MCFVLAGAVLGRARGRREGLGVRRGYGVHPSMGIGPCRGGGAWLGPWELRMELGTTSCPRGEVLDGY